MLLTHNQLLLAGEVVLITKSELCAAAGASTSSAAAELPDQQLTDARVLLANFVQRFSAVPHTQWTHVVRKTQTPSVGRVDRVKTSADGKTKFHVIFPPEKKPGQKGLESESLLPVVAATATSPEVGRICQVVQIFGGTYAGQFGITRKVGETAAKWKVELQGGKLASVETGHIHVVDTTQFAGQGQTGQENTGWVTGQTIINPPQRPYYSNYRVELPQLPAWLDEYQNDPAAPMELVTTDNRKGVAVHQFGLTSLGDATNRMCQAANTTGAIQPGTSTVVGTASTSTQSATSDAAEVNVGSVAAAVAADIDREWTLKFGCRRGHARYGREVSAMKSLDCMFSLVVSMRLALNTR
jgi:hypothetical protein